MSFFANFTFALARSSANSAAFFCSASAFFSLATSRLRISSLVCSLLRSRASRSRARELALPPVPSSPWPLAPPGQPPRLCLGAGPPAGSRIEYQLTLALPASRPHQLFERCWPPPWLPLQLFQPFQPLYHPEYSRTSLSHPAVGILKSFCGSSFPPDRPSRWRHRPSQASLARSLAVASASNASASRVVRSAVRAALASASRSALTLAASAALARASRWSFSRFSLASSAALSFAARSSVSGMGLDSRATSAGLLVAGVAVFCVVAVPAQAMGSTVNKMADRREATRVWSPKGRIANRHRSRGPRQGTWKNSTRPAPFRARRSAASSKRDTRALRSRSAVSLEAASTHASLRVVTGPDGPAVGWRSSGQRNWPSTRCHMLAHFYQPLLAEASRKTGVCR